MSKNPSNISCSQVLESFTMELSIDSETLTRYLRKYPQFADELVVLSNEIFVISNTEERELAPEDKEIIDAAWARIEAGTSAVAFDPFIDFPLQKARDIAKTLNVPRQIITAFRERTVDVGTVPQKFLNDLANLLNSTALNLRQLLTLPPQQVRSFKADKQPTEAGKVTFERLLLDAGLSDEEIKSLMEDGQ